MIMEQHHEHAGPSDQHAKVQFYSEKLVFDGDDGVAALDLSNPTRKVIHAGTLLRQNDPLKRSVNGWKELLVVLFDNYLVMAKPKGKGDELRYVAWKPPVRLELLELASLAVRPVQRSNTLSRMMRSGRDSPDAFSSLEQIIDSITPNNSGAHSNYYPVSFRCLGKNSGSYNLYTNTLEDRDVWQRKLKEAVAACRAAQEERSVFRFETITADTAGSQDAPAHHPGLITGRISCSLPFTRHDGRSLIAIGSEDGVWIGLPHQPESMQRVISLRSVTQIAFLAEFGFFVVLADKILYAIDIESVVPTNAQLLEQPVFGLQKLSGPDKHVHYFSAGHQKGRTLVVYKQRKGLDSIFSVLEVSTSSDDGSKKFTVLRSFFLPTDAYDLLFLKSKVSILCAPGFEIMEIADFSSVTIPLEEDLRKFGKRPLSSRPLSMFRIREDEFMLCYEDYGMYVDKRGSPSRSPPIIEWEGIANHAAWHPPYIVLFGSSFVEIRHVESGRLAQVIVGQDTRCLWDGRGVIRPDGLDEFDDPQTPRIHAVFEDSAGYAMAARPHSNSHPTSRRQHAVVLVPTERLVVPGTRYSPSLLSVADTLPPYVP